MKQCLLDMDGVLVDFVGGSLQIHNHKQTVDQLYTNNPGVWDCVSLMGMTQPAFWKPMNEEFWAKLDPLPDAFKILELVERKFGQENVMLLTSPSSNYGCHAGKLRWMERWLPRWYSKSKGHMFGSRKELLAHPEHLLVDDNNDNIDKFAARGGETFLVPRVWNREHAKREQAVDLLKEFLQL